MEPRRTLWTLYSVNFLNAVGGWFFLPLLPIFLGRKQASAALVGAVFASGLLANALSRYPAGWVADRFGTKPVMLVAMVMSAALFLVYLVALPPSAFIAVRFVQGAAQGAFFPAAYGLLAEVTHPRERGRAYGSMQATNLAGMLIAPGVGGLIALLELNAVFALASAMSLVAALALATLRNMRIEPAIESPVSPHALQVARVLLPLILLGSGTSYMIGVYDTTWSLYMTYRGGSTLAVGISFMAFALPAAVLSSRAGALGDRIGPRRMILTGLLCTGLFASIYPFVASIPWLIALGVVEGVFTISGVPSLMAEVSRAAGAGHQARTQGVYQTVQTAVEIAGALAGGALFTLSPTYSFVSITAICVLAASSALAPRVVYARLVRQTP